MITYLLPLLIANAGGRIVYKERGGVIACVATMGVIAGSNVPMFLGAMLVGPSAAWLMMKVDGIWEGKISPGSRCWSTCSRPHPRRCAVDRSILRDCAVRHPGQCGAR